MGKKRRNRKMNRQKPSSKNNRKRPVDEIDNGPIEKRLKTESKSEQVTFNSLPPEMLMEVLKYLDTKDVFACRLLNRKWNGVATEILQSRLDFKVEFSYSKDNGNFKLAGKENEDGMSLQNFIDCFHGSNNFPYTRFWFDPVDSSTFDNKHWKKFISDSQEQIKCLKLSTSSFNKTPELTLFTKKMRDFLLIQLPKLQEFGLNFGCTSNASEIELFPTSAENLYTPTQSGSKPVQLPHLKVLHLDESMFSKCTGIITDLFLAGINLKKIQPYRKCICGKCVYENYKMLENFEFLQSLGKLDCLESAAIVSTDNFLSNVSRISKIPLNFKLKSLDLHPLNAPQNDTIIFISKLFESCKDSLKELITDSLGHLNDLELPRFSRLTKIIGQGAWIVNGICKPFFPSGINPSEIFPVLDSLYLQIPWTAVFPQEDDQIPCIPTLKTLTLSEGAVDTRSIAQISKLCPNLKNLKILQDFGSGPMENFPEVGRAIWIHLKKLRSLKLHFCANGLDNAFPAFDSCITGFSTQYCKSLCHLLVADNLWRKCGPRVKIPESEMGAERKYPSILDLKDLESFELEVLYFYEDIEPEPDFARNGPTWISQECAFDLMKNLQCKIKKEALCFQRREFFAGKFISPRLEDNWRL